MAEKVKESFIGKHILIQEIRITFFNEIYSVIMLD